MSGKHVAKDQPTSFEFNTTNQKRIEEILKKYPPKRKKSAVMPLLDLSGSAFKLIPVKLSISLKANILFPTFNTCVEASKGKPSVTKGFLKQYSRKNSNVILLNALLGHYQNYPIGITF